MRSSKISAEPGPGGAPRLSAYLDTNVLIRMMERTDARADEAARLLALAEGGKLTLATSELTLSELLTGPMRTGDTLLRDAYLDLLTRDPLIALVPLSRDILIEAAAIRARSRAELADCLHAATAKLSGCDLIVSYDRRLRELGTLDVAEPGDHRFAHLEA